MEAFASAEDYLRRYPGSDGGRDLQTLLEDATAFLMGYLAESGVKVDPEDEVQARNLLSVTCSVVHRRLAVPDDLIGIKQATETAGPFTQSMTTDNPSEEMYLTASDKRLLGIAGRGRRGRLFGIMPEIRCGRGEPHDW